MVLLFVKPSEKFLLTDLDAVLGNSINHLARSTKPSTLTNRQPKLSGLYSKTTLEEIFQCPQGLICPKNYRIPSF